MIEGPGYVLVATGIFFLIWAVIALFSGEISGRGQILTRDERPISFFLTILTLLAGGVFLIYVAVTEHPNRARHLGEKIEQSSDKTQA